MFKKLEAVGSALLERLVPRVDASACGTNCWNDCWQCAHSACKVNTCTGALTCLSGNC
ncbi:hypothetical protein SAMN05428945_5481 [Streptomyces sp. 2224.1]|uniref:hypothetical protein n=1 Tax=unclassified Streptomyces TaxID=2593676 RepID=UPI00087F01E9|nr:MULTISPECIES: hypothetical protein [unclassified Streptomyces]PBC86932.1 hypothetical protein BX261_7053 [Streptomyces sp. 2321.6]SDQ67457.1 hypothetical protein SAMN05216511_0196 [Streptomyces sp. KS_16]SED36411.1 hypothetical protein SAMN05428954_0163 [Streptomyces sp. 2112.3]SED77597.1 hypothetical protein SAMN05428945_5481 [Streptomyces sp. 2224.1]SEE13990.1 hypothetical protein SAMN05428940_7077 [Streptomyces sp. 2133.1]